MFSFAHKIKETLKRGLKKYLITAYLWWYQRPPPQAYPISATCLCVHYQYNDIEYKVYLPIRDNTTSDSIYAMRHDRWENVTQQPGVPYFVTKHDLKADKLCRYSMDDIETMIDEMPEYKL